MNTLQKNVNNAGNCLKDKIQYTNCNVLIISEIALNSAES